MFMSLSQPMPIGMRQTETQTRFFATLMSTFLCLLLACIGSVTFGSFAQAADAIEALTIEIGELAKKAQYTTALQRAKELEAQARARDGELSVAYARGLGWEAFLTQSLGRIQDAGPLFQKSLEIYRSVLPANNPEVATSINNLAFFYQSTDKLDEAEALYKQALDLRETAKPVSPLAVADSLNNLAQLFKRQGRFAEAAPLLHRAFDIRSAALKPTDPLIAQSLTNIASLQELEGHYAEAEPQLRRVLTIRRTSQSADHPEVAGAISKLAQNLLKQGRFVEAEPLFEEALALRLKNQPVDHPDVSNTLHDRAQNLIMLGRYDEAESTLRRVIATRRKVLSGNNPSTAHAIGDLAETLLLQGRADEALQAIRDATAMIIERGKVDDLGRKLFAAFIKIAWHAAKTGNADRPQAIPISLQEETFAMGQRAAESQAALAIQMMGARLAAKDPPLQSLILEREGIDKTIVDREQALSASLAIAPEKRGAAVDSLRQEINSLNARKHDIDKQLQQRFPRYFRLIQPEPVRFEDVREALRPGEAFLQFYSSQDSAYVWAISQDGAAWQELPMSKADLEKAVTQLRNGLDLEELKNSGSAPKLFDLGIAHDLYLKLIAPVASVLAGKSELVIVPSGALTSLPFATLVVDEPRLAKPSLKDIEIYRQADWLVRHYAISILPSATSLKIVRDLVSGTRNHRPLIGFGNPQFGLQTADARAGTGQGQAKGGGASPQVETRGYATFWRGGAADFDALRAGLVPLPESETELKTVAQTLDADRSSIVVGAAATETAVKNADLAQFDVVYFATHGLVAGEIKGLGEPALALSLPAIPSAADDGLLTASEVAQLRMDADWVILSACNTAAGDKPGAEALSGLAKSFFHAGAHSLLVSHWRVGSEAAARLTTHTFRKMRDVPSTGRGQALQAAMVEMIDDTSDVWDAYPAFWAPFILVGDAGSVRANR